MYSLYLQATYNSLFYSTGSLFFTLINDTGYLRDLIRALIMRMWNYSV